MKAWPSFRQHPEEHAAFGIGLSRVTAVTHPDGTSATNTYTGRAVLSADEGNGNGTVQRISQSDGLGRLVSVCEVTSQTEQGSSNNSPASCGLDVSGTGFLTTYGYGASYGPLENLTSVAQGGVSRSFVYDSLGELKTATNPESGTTAYSYDNDSNLVSKTDANSKTTSYAYDSLNRLLTKSYSDGTASACFQYDSAARGVGRLGAEWTQAGTCSSTPPSSGARTEREFASYDLLGRVATDEQCATPGSCSGMYSVNYTYNLEGDVATFTNGLSGSLTYANQYNAAGRLSAVTDSENNIGLFTAATSNGYTPAGALMNAAIGSEIAFQRSYNSRLLPVSETDTTGASGKSTGTITFAGAEQSVTSGGTTTYDSGNFQVIVEGSSVVCTPVVNYGEESTPATLAAAMASALNSSCTLVTATASGAVVTLTSTNTGTGADDELQVYLQGWESDGGLFPDPSFTMTDSGSTMTGGGPTAIPLYNWSISSYAPDGDVLAMTDSVMGTWSYTYDNMNRLTSGTASAGVDDGLTLGWTYDRYGNRWAQNATGSGNASAVQPQLTFTGNNNRISGWSYDAAGNLLNDQIHTYTYDAENRIATLNGEPQYIYDAEGRRVAKTSSSGAPTNIYILGLGGEQVTELNGSGGWMHTNVFAAGGRLLATYAGPGDPLQPQGYYFHLTDWLGTNRMQTTTGGNQQEVCYSYPFGDGLNCTGTDATEHHFTGVERDTESGLDYFGARYLTTDLGRWMSPDLPFADQIPDNPQSWNLYGYVRDNPIISIDTNGRVTWLIGGTHHNDLDWSPTSDIGRAMASFQGDDDDVEEIPWSGGNSAAARGELAVNIVAHIIAHNWKPGEQDNIVCHSHGCNGVMAALPILLTDHYFINNLVSLGQPMRSDYPFTPGVVGHWWNVYARNDLIQKLGGRIPFFGGRTNPNATNIPVDAGPNPFTAHSALHGNPSAMGEWELFISGADGWRADGTFGNGGNGGQGGTGGTDNNPSPPAFSCVGSGCPKP